MVTMEIAGLYVVMVAAIVAGVLLLWRMIVELLRFDARANRPRSARIAPAAPPPVALPASLEASVFQARPHQARPQPSAYKGQKEKVASRHLAHGAAR
jgi:hypothetical protein